MTKTDITNLLEMNEIAFGKAILSQLQDNLDDINQLAMKADKSKEKIDYAIAVHELKRVAGRHEDMLNLANDLLTNVNERIEKSVKLINRGEDE